nr:hypothetical protein [Tanacetum cinerariifolium]
VILDDKKISTRELWKRQIIIARRHKQPASFGFYSPAKDEAETEGSVNTKMKKLSRVASIESETASTGVYSDNDSITCDDDDQGNQENAELKKGAEIKRRLKHFGKKSRYISGSAEVFEDNHHMELQESYYPYDDLSINISHETEDGSVSNKMKLKSYYDKGVNPTRNIQPTADEGTRSSNGIKAEGLKMKVLDTVDDIIDARSPSVYAGSPPHYQEDILHRRHNLEEEFLQLSAESISIASSDSDTSESGDDYGEIGSHIRFESTTDDLSRSMDRLSYFSCEDLQKMIENGSSSMSAFNPERRNSEQLDNNYEGNWFEKKMCKRKPKPRVVSLTEKSAKTAQTDDAGDPGKINYDEGMIEYEMLVDRRHSINAGTEMLPEKNNMGPTTEEFIFKNFKVDLADFGVEETCSQYVCCTCLLEDPSGCSKSGMTLLLSCEQTLYVVLLNGRHDGSGSRPSLVGCIGTEDVKEVLVGLGLQAVRVYAKRGARYMFITRSVNKSRLLISILEVFLTNSMRKRFSFISLDKIQVALFERDVCGGLKTNILQYSMVLFWNNNFKDDQWFPRSLFVLGGHMLVCIEDISQFGFDSQDTFTPYFSLDSCCAIVNALEMIIDTKERCCIALSLNSVTSEFNPRELARKSENEPVNIRDPPLVPVTWKLRWFSEDALYKFVALVKALHAGGGPTSTLNIRYT